MFADSSGQEMQVFELDVLAVFWKANDDLVFFDEGLLVTAVDILQFDEVGLKQLFEV